MIEVENLRNVIYIKTMNSNQITNKNVALALKHCKRDYSDKENDQSQELRLIWNVLILWHINPTLLKITLEQKQKKMFNMPLLQSCVNV